jgi:hypothetical protein
MSNRCREMFLSLVHPPCTEVALLGVISSPRSSTASTLRAKYLVCEWMDCVPDDRRLEHVIGWYVESSARFGHSRSAGAYAEIAKGYL